MQICLLDVDIQGGEKIHANEIVCKFLFIDSPSKEITEDRLRKRGTETEEVIKKRLKNGIRDTERAKELDYYKFIVNDDLNDCFATLVGIIEEHYGLTINH